MSGAARGGALPAERPRAGTARLFAALLVHELRLQWRFGFYAAYTLVGIAYIALLRMLPPDIAARTLAPLLFTEAGSIGLMFAGTLLQLERRDGAALALGVTPLHPALLVLARAAAFAVLIVAVGAAVAWLAGSSADIHAAGLLAALATAALLFVPLGLVLAARIATLDRFIVGGGLLSAVLGLPLLPYLGFAASPAWMVLPSYAVLRALGAALGQWPRPDAATSALLGAVTIVWTAAAYVAATRLLERRVFGRTEGAP